MARLPPRGSSVASPTKDRDEFKDILSAVCPSHTFDDLTIDRLYDQIAQVIGRWFSEEGRVEATHAAGALKTMRRNLTEACQTLGGHESGFHTGLEIETVSTLSEYLAKDPAVGSIKDAHALISSFRENAAKIAHAALAATADLEKQKAAAGRPTLDWYDDFTALLLRIAERAGIRPRLAKGRGEGTRSGWLTCSTMRWMTPFCALHLAAAPEHGRRQDRTTMLFEDGGLDDEIGIGGFIFA